MYTYGVCLSPRGQVDTVITQRLVSDTTGNDDRAWPWQAIVYARIVYTCTGICGMYNDNNTFWWLFVFKQVEEKKKFLTDRFRSIDTIL